MKAFEKWLDSNYSQVLPKSPIGQAIAYTYNIYPRLVRYVIDGRYRIDNNGAENGVRPLPWEGKTISSAAITRPPNEPQSFTHCWVHAK